MCQHGRGDVDGVDRQASLRRAQRQLPGAGAEVDQCFPGAGIEPVEQLVRRGGVISLPFVVCGDFRRVPKVDSDLPQLVILPGSNHGLVLTGSDDLDPPATHHPITRSPYHPALDRDDRATETRLTSDFDRRLCHLVRCYLDFRLIA